MTRIARGFTLIEMMVVTVIVLIVMGTGITLLNGTTSARNIAVGRVRATENARLFFQLLERDLASAHPGPNSPALIRGRTIVDPGPYPSPNTLIVEERDGGGQSYDILQFYTKTDAVTPADEYIFVRYYVNRSTGMLCRQVVPYDPLTPPAPETVDPRDYTDATSADAEFTTVSNGVLFDEVRAVYVVHRLWDPVSKTLVPTNAVIPDIAETGVALGTPLPQNCDHLRVMLVMRYSTDGGKTMTDRTFTKILPIPKSF